MSQSPVSNYPSVSDLGYNPDHGEIFAAQDRTLAGSRIAIAVVFGALCRPISSALMVRA
jgi:hypothetical protein